MIAIVISTCVILTVVVIDYWLPRRAFSRKKSPLIVEPEVNEDQRLPAPCIPANTIQPICGVVHYSRFNLPPSHTAEPIPSFTRAATVNSPGYVRKMRRPVTRVFALPSGHRRHGSHRSGLRRRRTID